MTRRIPLAQQIALLSEAAPTDFDPEDLNPANPPSDSEAVDKDEKAARDHYVDVGPSSLRKINQASISNPKYDGKRVSRKQLLEDNDDEDIRSGSEGEGSGRDFLEGSGTEDKEEEEEQSEGEASEDDDEEIVYSRVKPRALPAQPEPLETRKPTKPPQIDNSTESANRDIASALRATREQDRKKGKAVVQQISLWDTLLDARIRLQKAATAVNRLPQASTLQGYSAEQPFKKSLNAMLEEAISLSEDLFTLQDNLLRVDGSTVPPRKRVKLSHDGASERDYAKDLTILSATASEYEAAYHPYLIQTLGKWSTKVQAVAPNTLLPAGRGSFRNAMSGRTGAPGVVDVIDDTLRADAEKLLARTRHTRSRGLEHDLQNDANGRKEADVEAFDDTDFYQQLLRDIIEARGGAGGEGGEQEWQRRQKLLKAKRKKTVDTRASKGRKVRYQVHEKLQNFMVPIPAQRGAWHDEQIDELFASLLSSGR